MESSQIRSYNLRQSIITGASIGVSLALAFAAGFILRDLTSPTPIVMAAIGTDAEQNGYRLLDEVQNLLDDHYLREQPAYEERQYAAIRGVLGTLEDRYTFLIDPPVAQSESDVLAGTYGGVGVQIQRAENGDLVLFPFEESPALEVGILEGDVLIAINNEPVTFEEQQDAIDQRLRGEVKDDNGVEMTVRRDEEEIDFFVPFGVINVPSVVWRTLTQDETIGYVQVIRFTNRTPSELETALVELAEQNIQALVLDLRNNSGGLLQESVAVADQFLSGGVLVYESNTDEGERIFEAEDESVAPDVPLAVLVNGGTASAAELVAGAIQDRERGILIGQTTFGKGTVQQIFRLSDNSSLHVTSAEWFTPNRNELDGVGITPTITMIPDENGRDVELGEAIRYLQGETQ